MTNKYKVGGDVDAWCTKCKLVLAHSIIGLLDELPKKVKCKTCGGRHNYRLEPAKKSATKTRRTNKEAKLRSSNLEIYESHLKGFDLSKATSYKMEGSFSQDEVIDHPFFGPGIVVSIVNDKKIEIIFKEGPKLLVQNY